MLDPQVLVGPGIGLVDEADDAAALEQERRHERARHAEPAELLEHDRAIGPREAVGAQRKHTRFGQLGEHRAVEAAANTIHAEPAAEERGDPVAQRDLVGREVEVHVSVVPSACRAPVHR